MTGRPPPASAAAQRLDQTPVSRQHLSLHPKPVISLQANRRPPTWENIDPNTIEIVDLTDPSPSRPPRRPLDAAASDRPAKRPKGEETEAYISLDDDDERCPPPAAGSDVQHRSSPFQSGSLSQAKCVICLDSPTDLSATPCGISLLYKASDLGHLFCDFCIRSALKTGHASRGRGGGPSTYTGACPICRRKINTKSLVSVEIKVRTTS